MTDSVLFVAGPALGHIMRSLRIAEIVRERAPVHVATDGAQWADVIGQHGHRPIVLADITDKAALERGNATPQMRAIQRALDQDIALLRRLQPRVLVLDWRPPMRLAAAICGVPTVAVTNAYFSPAYRGPRAAPTEHPFVQLVGQRVGDMLMPVLEPLYQRTWSRPYRQLARRYGERGWMDLREYVNGDVTLFADLPSLNPVPPQAGVFIGPLTGAPVRCELPELRGPVLYITVGSEDVRRFMPGLARAAAGWPGDVVVTCGGFERAGGWPESWVVRPYVDPAAIYAQGKPVAWIYHGGNGSTYQLLEQWVMSEQTLGAVVLPFHVEQQWNADKLRRLGAAPLVTSIHRVHRPETQRAVAAALRRLLETPVGRPSDALAEEVRSYQNAPERAAAEIRKWL